MAIALAALFNTALLAVGLYALICGDRPEKFGAFVNLAASVLTTMLQVAGIASWRDDGLLSLVDVVALAAFFWLAVRTNRFWPIWSFGFVLAVVAADVAKGLDPEFASFVTKSGQTAYVYAALVSLALGTFRASRAEPDPLHGFRPSC